MIDQLTTNFFWPGLSKDAKRWVMSCSVCKKRKTPRPMRSGVTKPVFALFPNHAVAIDIVGPLVESTDGRCFSAMASCNPDSESGKQIDFKGYLSTMGLRERSTATDCI